MIKSFKYRLYPNTTQKISLAKTFGCVRYFWNKQVESFNTYDKESKLYPVFKTSTEIRNETVWMKEVSAAAVQQKEIDFKEFKKQFFSKTRKSKINFPRFKKKGGRDSFRLPSQKFKLLGDEIQIEKIGKVKVVTDRQLPEGKLLSATISKNPDNRYYVSIIIECEIKNAKLTGKSVGIDVGLKEFAVLSDGKIIPNPKYFRKNQAKLANIQKRFSKKKKGSIRRKKFKLKVARCHSKISRQRNHFLHELSTSIVKEYDIISVEDLNVKGMVKNRKLSKSISDASFSMFHNMLRYKSEWYGKQFIKIDRWFPSSKTCSSCGNIKESLLLSDRVYNCDSCGLSMDRDLNASINIKALGVNNAIRTPRTCKTSSNTSNVR